MPRLAQQLRFGAGLPYGGASLWRKKGTYRIPLTMAILDGWNQEF